MRAEATNKIAFSVFNYFGDWRYMVLEPTNWTSWWALYRGTNYWSIAEIPVTEISPFGLHRSTVPALIPASRLLCRKM